MRTLLRLCCCLCLQACGDGESGGADGTADCDGAQAFAPASTMFPGDRMLRGAVDFPADTAPGRQIRLQLLRPGLGREEIDVGETDAVDRVCYRVTVEPGTYLIGLEVDQVDDRMLGTGDFRGFYDGTLGAPKILEADATSIDATTADRADLDFGLGVYAP